MLKTKLTHPQILYALGRAGHGSSVLLADGDYPVSTTAGKNAEIVHLNLSAGVVSCTQILEVLLPTILVEAAAVMDVPQGQAEPEIWATYRQLLLNHNYSPKLKKIERFAFYEETAGDHTALVIQTGETREYANLLITIGSL